MMLAKLARYVLAIAFAHLSLVLCLLPATPALAQTPQSGSQPQPQQDEAGVEDNPTRVVFLSIRNEYRNLRNGAWNNRAIIRKDALALKGKPVVTRGLLLRADIPITTT